MLSLTNVMISMSIADISNGVNGTGVFDEGALPGRVAGGQQPAPGRYPVTAAQESGPRKGRRKSSIEENSTVVEKVQNRDQGGRSCD